jgi:hypothetical protein
MRVQHPLQCIRSDTKNTANLPRNPWQSERLSHTFDRTHLCQAAGLVLVLQLLIKDGLSLPVVVVAQQAAQRADAIPAVLYTGWRVTQTSTGACASHQHTHAAALCAPHRDGSLVNWRLQYATKGKRLLRQAAVFSALCSAECMPGVRNTARQHKWRCRGAAACITVVQVLTKSVGKL